MGLQQQFAARLILEQQRPAACCRYDFYQPLDDRLKQRIEFGLFAKSQRQLVKQCQSLRPLRIKRLIRPKYRRRGIDNLGDIQKIVVGVHQCPLGHLPPMGKIGSRFGKLDLDNRVADCDFLTGL